MTFATEEETTQEQAWTQQIHQQEFQFPKSWRELKVALVPLWASLQTPVGAFAGLLMATVVVSGAILFLVTFLSFDSHIRFLLERFRCLEFGSYIYLFPILILGQILKRIG
jgi:hypothetical protein